VENLAYPVSSISFAWFRNRITSSSSSEPKRSSGTQWRFHRDVASKLLACSIDDVHIPPPDFRKFFFQEERVKRVGDVLSRRILENKDIDVARVCLGPTRERAKNTCPSDVGKIGL
jgi:hypothetical protein